MIIIRLCHESDAREICRIYNPYIANTTISFEEETLSNADMTERIRNYGSRYPWYVAADGEKLIGYAYTSPWGVRSAYRYTVEISLYVDARSHRKGTGSQLYQALLRDLRDRSFHSAIASIA